MNFSVTITLGSGDKGKQWNDAIRKAATKNRMSVGAFVRMCIRMYLMKEAPPKIEETAPAKPEVVA